LLFERRRVNERLATIAALLALVAMGDAWSYTTSMATVALSAGALVLRAFRDHRAHVEVSQNDRHCIAGLALMLMGVGVLQAMLGRGMRGDVLVRAGLGAPWREAVTGLNIDDTWLGAWLTSVAVVLVVVWGIALWQRNEGVPFRDAIATEEVGLVPVLALLPAVAVAGATLALSRVGMEAFQAHHLYFRADFCQLFALVLAVCEAVRMRLGRDETPATHARWRRVMAVVLAALFALHSYRLQNFVAGAWFDEFRLTRDHEALRRWLTGLPEHARGKVLATASPELNYLCAYWSDAELLLPVGFPYHNNAPSSAIVERMADLLRVYQTHPRRWRGFSLNSHPRDVFSWHANRVFSARDGFTYQLFHRAVMLQGYPPRPDRSRYDDAIARSLALRALRPVARVPDFIVLDPVSRALGMPDLAGYRRVFASGTLEVWMR
jgi:hypothetical protein